MQINRSVHSVSLPVAAQLRPISTSLESPPEPGAGIKASIEAVNEMRDVTETRRRIRVAEEANENRVQRRQYEKDLSSYRQRAVEAFVEQSHRAELPIVDTFV